MIIRQNKGEIDMSSTTFQIAQASVTGMDHVLPGMPVWKNNQDAVYSYSDSSITIGIVADGCGSKKSSEIGAYIGSRLLGERIKFFANRILAQGGVEFDRWQEVRSHVLGHIAVLSSQLGDSPTETIDSSFLFSILGFLIMGERTYIFSCGDGSYAINGAVTKIGPFPNNAPPYLSYGIADENDARSHFEIQEIKTQEVISLCVMTDGVDHFPDFGMKVITEWSNTNAIFKNPDALRRRLAVLNCEHIENNRLLPGPLSDDTSIVLTRRKPEGV